MSEPVGSGGAPLPPSRPSSPRKAGEGVSVDDVNADVGVSADGRLVIKPTLKAEFEGRAVTVNPPSRGVQRALWVLASLLLVGAAGTAAYMARQFHMREGWSWSTIVETAASPVAFVFSAAIAINLYRTRGLTARTAGGMDSDELAQQRPERLATLDAEGLEQLLMTTGAANLTSEQRAALPREIQELWDSKEAYVNKEGHEAKINAARIAIQGDPAARVSVIVHDKTQIDAVRTAVVELLAIQDEIDKDFEVPVLSLQTGQVEKIALTKGDLRSLPRYSDKTRTYERCQQLIDSAVERYPQVWQSLSRQNEE